MRTKFTQSKPVPLFGTTVQHSQYIKPDLSSAPATLVNDGGTFSAFMPKSVLRDIHYRCANHLIHDFIAERIAFGLDNVEVLVPSPDFISDITTVMVKITPKTYEKADALSQIYFGGNIGLAIGWLASLGINPKKWGVRPAEEKIHLPWVVTSAPDRVVSAHMNYTEELLDLRHLPSEWPTPSDLEQVRLATGLSATRAAGVLGRGKSAARYYERGIRGNRQLRYRAVLEYVRWMEKNAPHRLADLDKTARGLAKSNIADSVMTQSLELP